MQFAKKNHKNFVFAFIEFVFSWFDIETKPQIYELWVCVSNN